MGEKISKPLREGSTKSNIKPYVQGGTKGDPPPAPKPLNKKQK